MDPAPNSDGFRLRPVWPIEAVAEVRDALARVFESGDWGRYHGDECKMLQIELSDLHDGRDVWLCSSGTIGVELALRALGVSAKDEVALAGYDFPGNFRAIESIGARPVLVDLVKNRWTLGVETLEEALSPQLKAVIVSHLHGTVADMPSLVEWAKSRGILIVEDACQVPGAAMYGAKAGTFGDVGVMSFGGSKLLTAGRGGAVLCRTPQQLQRVRIFAERGNDAFPLSELQAAVVRAQLTGLKSQNDLRATRARQLYRRTSHVRVLRAPEVPSGVTPVYYKLGWWLNDEDEREGAKPRRETPQEGHSFRAAVIAKLQARGLAIDAGFRGFATRSERRCRHVGGLQHARYAANRTLILHHPVLLESSETIDQVAKIVAEAFDA